MGQHIVHPLIVGKSIGSNLNPTPTKDVESGSYCFYVRCLSLIVRVGGMPRPKTGATHYNAQLGLLIQRVLEYCTTLHEDGALYSIGHLKIEEETCPYKVR